jgi:hypothetical protein
MAWEHGAVPSMVILPKARQNSAVPDHKAVTVYEVSGPMPAPGSLVDMDCL